MSRQGVTAGVAAGHRQSASAGHRLGVVGEEALPVEGVQLSAVGAASDGGEVPQAELDRLRGFS